MAGYIGEVVRLARQEAKRSQEELARMAGVARISVMNLELGREKNPKLQTVFAITRELSIDLGGVISGYENRR